MSRVRAKPGAENERENGTENSAAFFTPSFITSTKDPMVESDIEIPALLALLTCDGHFIMHDGERRQITKALSEYLMIEVPLMSSSWSSEVVHEKQVSSLLPCRNIFCATEIRANIIFSLKHSPVRKYVRLTAALQRAP